MERRNLTRGDLKESLIGAIVTNEDQSYGNAVVIGLDYGNCAVTVSTQVYNVQSLPIEKLTLIAKNLQEHVAAVVDRQARSMSSFKEEVGRKAMAAARENDWCNEVRDLLGELDIPTPNEHVDARVTVTFDLTFLRLDQSAWDKTDLQHPNLDWVRQSFSVTDDELTPAFEGDSQLELKDVRYVAREVLELRESVWED